MNEDLKKPLCWQQVDCWADNNTAVIGGTKSARMTAAKQG